MQFIADGVFYAELNELLTRELAEDGYSGVEVRVTPMRTEIIIRATLTQKVLGEVAYACATAATATAANDRPQVDTAVSQVPEHVKVLVEQQWQNSVASLVVDGSSSTQHHEQKWVLPWVYLMLNGLFGRHSYMQPVVDFLHATSMLCYKLL